MIKFVQLMTFRVGEKSICFTGREPFEVNDLEFEKSLLGLGVFERLEDGSLRYSGDLTVSLKNGKTMKVDPRGFLPISKKDLADKNDPSFR